MVEVIAHRGASYDAPENTLSSVKLAWQQQSDAVEIDCRLTSDGQIVVIHDEDTRRVTGSALRIEDTPWSQLKDLDCGLWKGSDWAGQRLNLLAEVIEAVPSGKRLLIEVKCGVEILSALANELERAKRVPSDLVVICFDDAVVAGIKQMLPASPAYLLSRTPRPATATRKTAGLGPHWLKDLIERARRASADGLDLEDGPAIDRTLVNRAEQIGLPCYVWTVDSGREARRLRDAGIRGITTNRPGWLRGQLAGDAGAG